MYRRLQPYVPEAAALCIQVAFADRLLLNKTDLVTADDLIRVEARLLLATYYLLLATHSVPLTTHYLLLCYFLLPTPYFPPPPPTSYLLPPTSYFLLPTSYFLLPTSYVLLPTSNLLLTYDLLTTPWRRACARSTLSHPSGTPPSRAWASSTC